MSLLLTQRLALTPAFATYPPPLALMDTGPLGSLQVEIGAVEAMKADVEARLSKYMSAVDLNRSAAQKAMNAVGSWSRDFGAAMEKLPPDAPIPESQRPRLPREEAQNYIKSIFFEGAYGFHFYKNGVIAQKIQSGEWTREQAQEDLAGRRRCFQLLTAMDEDGAFARAFGSGPMGALGLEPVTVGIIIAVVAIVGVLIYQSYNNQASRAQVITSLEKLCKEAEQRNDRDTMQQCVQALKPVEHINPVEQAIWVLGGLGALFLIGYYVAPKLIHTARTDRLRSRVDYDYDYDYDESTGGLVRAR